MSECIASVDEIEIEITPAMIEAGAIAVSLYNLEIDTAEDRAIAVFQAMMNAAWRVPSDIPDKS